MPARHSTVYPVIADPPSAGATQLTVICRTPAATVGAAGVDGAPAVVTEFDAADVALVPTEFVAETRHVYAVLSSRPVTVVEVPGTVPYEVHETAAAVLHSTAYPVIGEPPVVGAVQVNDTCFTPAVAEGAAGVPGAVGSAHAEPLR